MNGCNKIDTGNRALETADERTRRVMEERHALCADINSEIEAQREGAHRIEARIAELQEMRRVILAETYDPTEAVACEAPVNPRAGQIGMRR